MSNSGFPQRCVLDGVPRVGFFGDVKDNGGKPWPEDFIFPSCLRAILEYRGDTRYDYVRLLGVSGGGFYLNWNGWEEDNPSLYWMYTNPEDLITNTVDAIGYELTKTPPGLPGANPGAIRDFVIREINAGRPCLCNGAVGPPEPSIITGYDEGGDVLIGWSFFQSNDDFSEDLEFEPSGYFRRRNWESAAWDAIGIGEKTSDPDSKEQYRKALERGLTVARTAKTYEGRANGLAAYDAWLEHLQRDDEIANWKPGDTSNSPFDTHRGATETIAEGRYYLSNYIARDVPECMPYQASHLYAAASCYAKQHELMWEVWRNEGGTGSGSEERARANFADPAVRGRSIEIIRQARDFDAQAADHIEAALEAAK